MNFFEVCGVLTGDGVMF